GPPPRGPKDSRDSPWPSPYRLSSTPLLLSQVYYPQGYRHGLHVAGGLPPGQVWWDSPSRTGGAPCVEGVWPSWLPWGSCSRSPEPPPPSASPEADRQRAIATPSSRSRVARWRDRRRSTAWTAPRAMPTARATGGAASASASASTRPT